MFACVIYVISDTHTIINEDILRYAPGQFLLHAQIIETTKDHVHVEDV